MMGRRKGEEEREPMAYQLTFVLSAPLSQLPAFHADLVVRQITSFHFPGRDWHSCCLSSSAWIGSGNV